MSFAVYTGLTGAGKTQKMFEEVRSHLEERPQIIVVPETSSYVMERRLIGVCGNGASLSAEVLTFRSMARRVAGICGGLCDQYLDEAGRLLVARRAVEYSKSALKIYAGVASKTEFLKKIVDFIDHAKTSQMLPEDLLQQANEMSEILQIKLSDLAVIFENYLQLTQSGTFDPRDANEKMIQQLENSACFSDCDFYFDGFSGFTVQEYQIISTLCGQANNMSFYFTCDALEKVRKNPGSPFSLCGQCIDRLKRMAKQTGIPCAVWHMPPPEEKKASRFLSEELFQNVPKSLKQQDMNVEVYAATDIFEECEHVAARILREVRTNKKRFSDFAVVSCAFEQYAPILELVFQRYDIPVFISKKTDVLARSPFRMLIAAVKTVTNYFEHDSLFSFLRLCDGLLSADETDVLENYTILWNLSGKAWLQEKAWQWNPEGFDAVIENKQERLTEINELRDRARHALLHLKKDFDAAALGNDYLRALYSFSERIHFQDQIIKMQQRIRDAGDYGLALEYDQLEQIYLDAMTQFDDILGKEKMDAREFVSLFSLSLAAYQVGTIPPAVDMVTAGDASACASQQFDTVLILGAQEGAFPPPAEQKAVFTADEVEEMNALGWKIYESREARHGQNAFDIYRMITSAQRLLLFSYAQNFDGRENIKPARLLKKVLRILPELSIKPVLCSENPYMLESVVPARDAAFRGLTSGSLPYEKAALRFFMKDVKQKELFLKVQNLVCQRRGPITNQHLIHALYGNDIRITASRAEKFESCRFAYFMQFGLRAKPRKKAAFDAPQLGTFVHYILENVVKDFYDSASDKEQADSRNIVLKLCDHYTEKYVDEVLGGLEDKPQRFVHLFGLLQRSVRTIVNDALDELEHSLFRPLDFELDFSEKGDLKPHVISFPGGSVKLCGKVDRVDGYVKDQTLYLKIVDYKTGDKKFSLSEVADGLGLQLLIYLFALEEEGLLRYQEKLGTDVRHIKAAGALYFPANDPVLSLDSKEVLPEKIQQLRQKEHQRSGLLLNDEHVLEAVETGIEQEGCFVPIKFNKDHTLSARSPVASEEEFEKLKNHIWKLLSQMGEMILEGNTEANPFTNGVKSACDFCDYKEACLFDVSGPGDKMRVLKKMDRADVMKRI